MTEMLLNAVWLALAGTVLMMVPRRSGRATIALLCVLALLFPIISASDDFNADQTLEQAALAIMAALLLIFAGLVALGHLEHRDERVALIHVATPSDPRSPPRA